MSHTHRSPKSHILHSASYTKTQLPPKMVARLPKMVAFSADYPPDGAISSVKCCSLGRRIVHPLVFWGRIPSTCVCACADRRSTTINYAKREGVRSARKSQDCFVSTAVSRTAPPSSRNGCQLPSYSLIPDTI